MKYFHTITITVFSKQEENAEEIKEALKRFITTDLEKEKITLKEEEATGFDNKKITILTLKLTKQKHIKQFLKELFSKFTKMQEQQLIDELNTRVDEECFFYLRLDKESWIKKEKIFIIDGGNCFHIKFKIASYPCNKERAKITIQDFLQNIFKDK